MFNSNYEQMVLNNTKLVYFVINKLYLKPVEDYYDVGLVGLCKGCKSFDSSKGYSLSTYLTSCIKNELLCQLRKEKHYVDLSNSISLESTFTNNDENVRLMDLIPSNVNIEDEFSFELLQKNIKTFMEALVEEEKFIFISIFKENMSQKEIASILNSSQAQISKKLRLIKNKLKVYLEREMYV